MAALEGVEPALREGLSGRAVDVMLVCVFPFSRVDGAALRARASTGVDGGAAAPPSIAKDAICEFWSARARESAAFFISWRRVEALQLIMDAASHGSRAFTGVSLFG